MIDLRTNITVPPEYEDVCRELVRRRKSVFIPSVIWVGAVVLLEYWYLWQYFNTRLGVPGAIVVGVVLVLVFPIHRGILSFLFERGWEGVVRDVKKKSYIHINGFAGGRHGYSRMSTRIEGHLYLYGRTGRPKLLEKYLPVKRKFILRSGDDELPYRSGDRLRCYAGCRYPVIVTRDNMDGYPPRICVFCGKAETDRARSCCDFCGFSLITPSETVNAVEYGM